VADVFSKKKRSAIMANVKGRGNEATELRLIRILRDHGITGWRRNAQVFGSPDFVFPERRVAVFVDGCFWHGCPIDGDRPATNRAFWNRKISGNMARDRHVNYKLRKEGWSVVRVWQHDLRNPAKVAGRIRRALSTRRA
jgi:DNA mismatch endonuclease (patch repair protein)